jgi:phosphorylcholine metabolism protein LicD
VAEHHLILKDLEIALKVIKEMNLRIFLEGGTLLGAIREKDFLSHDCDFDFGILRKEFSKDSQKELIAKLTTVQDFTFKGYECKAFKQRVEFGDRPYMIKFWSKYAHWNTDFWIFEETETEYYHRGWCGYFYFPKECLNTLDEIEFLGLKVLVPHNPELYLQCIYGKNWKIPNPKFKKPNDYNNWKRNLK